MTKKQAIKKQLQAMIKTAKDAKKLKSPGLLIMAASELVCRAQIIAMIKSQPERPKKNHAITEQEASILLTAQKTRRKIRT